MQSLVNCIRARVGSEPGCVAREGWWRGQGPGMARGARTAPGENGGGFRMFGVVTWQTQVVAWCRWLGFAAEPGRQGTRRKSNLACSRTDFLIPALSQHAAGYLLRQQTLLIIALWLLWSGKLAIEPVQTAQVSDVFFSPLSPLR